MKLPIRFSSKGERRAPIKPPADVKPSRPPVAELALADLGGWRAQRGLLLVGLLTLAAVVLVSLHIGEISEFGARITGARPSWIAAALVAQFFAFFFLALAWGAALASFGGRRPMRDLFPLTLGTLFADQAIPTAGLSGALFILHSLTRRGVARETALAVFMLGAASFIGAFLIFAIASFAILAVKQESAAAGAIATAGIVILVFLALSVATVISVLHFKFVHELIARAPFLQSASRFAARAAASIRADRLLFARCLARQIFARGFDVITLWLCFAAIGERTGLEVSFVAVSIASLAATLAPTPMGIGSFEGAMVAILSSLGVSVETALTATLLYRGLSLWAPLSLGFFVVQKELLAQRLQPDSAADRAAIAKKP